MQKLYIQTGSKQDVIALVSAKARAIGRPKAMTPAYRAARHSSFTSVTTSFTTSFTKYIHLHATQRNRHAV